MCVFTSSDCLAPITPPCTRDVVIFKAAGSAFGQEKELQTDERYFASYCSAEFGSGPLDRHEDLLSYSTIQEIM